MSVSLHCYWWQVSWHFKCDRRTQYTHPHLCFVAPHTNIVTLIIAYTQSLFCTHECLSTIILLSVTVLIGDDFWLQQCSITIIIRPTSADSICCSHFCIITSQRKGLGAADSFSCLKEEDNHQGGEPLVIAW